MTDFYAQLEQQLVAAAGRRRDARGRVRRAMTGRGRPLAGVAALAVAVAAAAVAVALPQRDSGQRRGPAAPALPAVPAPSVSRDLSGIRVAVLNATTQPGVARATAAQLASLHARIVAVGNAPRQPVAATEVRHRRGARAKARRVAQVLGVARVGPGTGWLPNAGRAEVIVLVGVDRQGQPQLEPRPRVPAPPTAPRPGVPQAAAP